MKAIIQIIAVCAIVAAAPAWAETRGDASQPQSAAGAALPPQWDPRIPLPKGATLISSTKPRVGVVFSADFSAPGDFKELMNFYETELPKAGFAMGPKVATPARRVYNRTFTAQDILDSVVISPSSTDPSRLIIHIAYTPPVKRGSKTE